MAKFPKTISRPFSGLWQATRSNPIVLKELRGRMRGWRGVFNLSFYTIVLGLFGLLSYVLAYNSRNNDYYTYYSNGLGSVAGNNNLVIKQMNSYGYGSADIGNQLLLALIIAEIILVVFLSPAFTVGTIASEKERQTYDILITTLLRPRDIVLGKLFSSQAYLILMIVASLPVLSIIFLVGGISLSQLFIGFLVCLMSSLMMGAISIYWSAASRTAGRAFRSVFFIMLILFAAIPAMGLMLESLVRTSYYNSGAGFANPYITPAWLQVFNSTTLAFNPVAALITSYTQLSSHSTNSFTYNYFQNSYGVAQNNGLVLPMPWVTFTIIAFFSSLLFIWLATRRVKPLNYGPGGFKLKRGKPKAVPASSAPQE